MAEVINMPRLSDTMEEGTVATWLKKVGDTVKEGDILAEIETDKATMEFESFYEGTLLHIGVKEGETVAVDSLLAIIGDKDEDISALIDGKSVSKEDDSSDKKKTSDSDKDDKSSDKKEEKQKESKDDSSAKDEKSELPKGVEVITMPRLSDTMTEGTVATWLKKEGDKVEEGDILAEIETDKATMEFESFYAGVLLKIGVGEGESAPVDSVLAIIGSKDTDISGIIENFKKDKKTSGKKEDSPKSEDKVEEKVPAKKTEDSRLETTTAPAPTSQAASEGRIFASPLARKMAEEKGINLRHVRGSGDQGRIVRSDIENYQPATDQAYVPVGTESFEEVKNSQMRKTIAKRLAESKFTAPEYYLTVELDMDQAISSRTVINADRSEE